ncbi:MAG: sulfite exporter TauE/SafE family protein [Thermodesulfovibrionia bacterium]|nr:sulfite exporter TauE/SafE family protein [Thermodesulfovibrionia bacterium]
MSNELLILIIAAASIGFFHTLLGPDHYLPFIVMSRSRNWSLRKTSLVTVLCGIGHVLSSALLGIIGIALGIAVSKLEAIESFRGSIAAWVLIAFGLVYFIWGMRRALRSKPHEHLHKHKDGFSHMHTHNHTEVHMHVHRKKGTKNITPWVLFTIFVFGPCEPLIPLLMYPAAKNSLLGVVLVTGLFSATTILTMLGIVLISTFGVNLIPMNRLERYTHAIAGATICLCGVSIQFLGL